MVLLNVLVQVALLRESAVTASYWTVEGLLSRVNSHVIEQIVPLLEEPVAPVYVADEHLRPPRGWRSTSLNESELSGTWNY